MCNNKFVVCWFLDWILNLCDISNGKRKMNKYGAKRVTTMIDGTVYNFRSRLEYRYGIYLNMLKWSAEIQEWCYESEDMAIEFQHGRYGNTRKYLPDFAILNNGDEWEIHETKGCFKPLDYTKLKKYSEMHGNKITLIFAKLRNCKSLRPQYNRTKKIEPHIHRVIWEADRDLFKPIKYLFDY